MRDSNKYSFDKLLLIVVPITVIGIGAFGCWLYWDVTLRFDETFGHALLSRNGKLAEWAHWGDYLSGQLTPIFSLLGLIALLLTIILQSRELSLTREELRHTRIAQQKSAAAIELTAALDKARFIMESRDVLAKLDDEIEDVQREIQLEIATNPTAFDSMTNSLLKYHIALSGGGLLPGQKRKELNARAKSLLESRTAIASKLEEIATSATDTQPPV